MPTKAEIFGDRLAKTDIDVGLLQLQILWLLNRKSTHGYDLMKSLEQLRHKKITQGTLYPTLQKLEGAEFVQREEDGMRIVYHITKIGKETLQEASVEFCKTFFGIFQDFVCTKCVAEPAHSQEGGK